MKNVVKVNGVTLTRAQVEEAFAELNKPEPRKPLAPGSWHKVVHRNMDLDANSSSVGVDHFIIAKSCQSCLTRLAALQRFWNDPDAVFSVDKSGHLNIMKRGAYE